MANAAYTNLLPIVLTATEQANVAAVGLTGADAKGILEGLKLQLKESIPQLQRISANMGAGANKTALDAWIAIIV